jgi:hypothetical protein
VTGPAALLRALAVPRLTGSESHAAVRGLLKQELAARGLVVDEHTFMASDGPLRRAAFAAELTAVAALAFAVGAVAGDPVSGARIAAVPIVALVGVLLFVGRGTRHAPGVNLVGQREGQKPGLWLTAHYDTKGQRLSMAVRLGAILALAVQAPACVALIALWIGGHRSPWLALLVLPAIVGGILLSRADLRNDSPGAVDNASGVVTALATFDRLPPSHDIGIVFTDAEEWGLQGTHALLQQRGATFRDTAIVNFDGIDRDGVTIILEHRRGPLAARLQPALAARRLRWLPVLVDGMAFGPVSRECFTVMRGGWQTMRRVHTPRDEPARLQLDGIERVASAVADVLQRA